MRIALREAKESRVGLLKLRVGNLDHHANTARLELESEATQLSAIFAAIIRNMCARLERDDLRKTPNKRKGTGNW